MLEVFDSPKHLYHYTDLNALISILRNSELWLTSVNFLNDHEEYTVGRNFVREQLYEYVEKVTEMATNHKLGYDFKFIDAIIDRPVYLTSFCMGKDLLSQWRGYCPETGGYAIEFTGQKIADDMVIEKDTKFLVCNYDEEIRDGHLRDAVLEVIRIINEMIINKDKKTKDDLLKDVETLNFTLFSTLVQKHHKFSEEKEVRLGCQSTEREKKFRVKNSTLIPYIPISFDVNTISGILIGPMTDQKLAQRGLEQFLESLVNAEDHPLKAIPNI